MLNVTVKRSRWLHGTGAGSLLEDGKMCCLGFACREVGLKPKEIRGHGMPADTMADLICDKSISKKREKTLLEKLKGLLDVSVATQHEDAYIDSSKVADTLSGINDNEITKDFQEKPKGWTGRFTEANREKLIKKYGLNAGIKFKFVD